MEMLTLTEIRNTLQFSLSEIEHVLSLIKTDVRNDLRRSAILIFCSIYEQSYVCVDLINSKGANTVPIIVRSILESQIDLENIANDENEEYVISLRVKFLEKRKKFYKNYVTKFEGKRTKKEKEIEKKYESTINELKSLKKSGASSLSIYQKFSNLNLNELYATHYATVCLDSHNDISILEKKHLSIKRDSIDFEVFKRRDVAFIKAYLRLLISALYSGICNILIILDIEKDQKTNEILTQLKIYSDVIISSEIEY